MASFLDRPAQFNPYIATRPVQTEAYVGEQLQQQYNQGVEKVQSLEQTLAGLPVIRDVDKQYLNNKVNSFKSEINKMAGADWSNPQALNRASGIAAAVYNDPVIQNAVAGTAQYKSLLGDIDQAKTSGKGYAIQNEWDALKSAQNWLSDQTPGAVYTGGKYSPYVDVNKKATDTLSKLHPDWETEVDPLNENGITAYTIKEGHKEYISKDKVRSALNATLEPDDWNQLSINGRYAGKDFTDPNQYSSYLDSLKNSYTKQYDKAIATYRDAISKNQNDPLATQQLNALIDEANKNRQNAEITYNTFKQQVANGGMEDVKGSLYSLNWMNDLADTYGYTKEDYSIKKNPLFEAQMDIQKEQRAQQQYLLDLQKFNLEQQKFANEQTKEANKTSTKGGTVGTGEYYPLEISNQQAHDLAINFGQNTEAMQAQFDNEKYATLYDYVTSSQGEQAAEALFNHTTDAQGNPIFMPKKGKEKDVMATYQDLHNKYDADPASIDSSIASHFGQVAEQEQIINARTKAFNRANEVADREVGGLKTLLKDFGGLSIPTQYGNQVYTPQELYDFNDKLSQFIHSAPVGTGGASTYVTPPSEANSQLTEKQRTLYNYWYNEFIGNSSPGGRIVAGKLSDINNKVNRISGELGKQRAAVIAREIAPYIKAAPDYVEDIPSGKAEERARVRSLLNNVFFDLNNPQAPQTGYDRSEIAKLEKDDNTTYAFLHGQDGSVSLRMSNPALSKETYNIPLPATYVNANNLRNVDPVANIKQLLTLNRTPTGTAYTGNSLQTALPLNNPNFQRYRMKYTIAQNRDGSMTLGLYIYDKQAQKWLYQNQPYKITQTSSIEGILAMIQSPQFEQKIAERIGGNPITANPAQATTQSDDPRTQDQYNY